MTFPTLFSPLRIRDLEIRNRILSTGYQTFQAQDGVPGEDLIAHHEARARGEGFSAARAIQAPVRRRTMRQSLAGCVRPSCDLHGLAGHRDRRRIRKSAILD